MCMAAKKCSSSTNLESDDMKMQLLNKKDVQKRPPNVVKERRVSVSALGSSPLGRKKKDKLRRIYSLGDECVWNESDHQSCGAVPLPPFGAVVTTSPKLLSLSKNVLAADQEVSQTLTAPLILTEAPLPLTTTTTTSTEVAHKTRRSLTPSILSNTSSNGSEGMGRKLKFWVSTPNAASLGGHPMRKSASFACYCNSKDCQSTTELNDSVERVLQAVETDHWVKTGPSKNRLRRTLIIQRAKGKKFGFTLQTYAATNVPGFETDTEELGDDDSKPLQMLTYVDYVELNSPAFVAGLRAGDVLLSINGHDISQFDHKSLTQYISWLQSMRIVAMFENVVEKVRLYTRAMKLESLLRVKEEELRALCIEERDILRRARYPTFQSAYSPKAPRSSLDSDLDRLYDSYDLDTVLSSDSESLINLTGGRYSGREQHREPPEINRTFIPPERNRVKEAIQCSTKTVPINPRKQGSFDPSQYERKQSLRSDLDSTNFSVDSGNNTQCTLTDYSLSFKL